MQVGGRCWDCGDPPRSPGADASPSRRPWQKPASFPPHEVPHGQADIQGAGLQQCCCCIRETSHGGRSVNLQELTPPSRCPSRVRVRLANKQLQVHEVSVTERRSDICTPASVWQERGLFTAMQLPHQIHILLSVLEAPLECLRHCQVT